MDNINSAVIEFDPPEDVHTPSPWPVGINDKREVTSGLGDYDGSVLVGFSPEGMQVIEVFAADAFEHPEKVVGLVPTFSNNGNLFLWNIKVRALSVRVRGVIL